MNVNPVQSPHIDASSLTLEQLSASTKIPEGDKIKEVSRAFESVLLHQILSETQKPVFASKYVGNSTIDGIYRDMVANQMAEDISKSGAFGLGKSLSNELQVQAKNHHHEASPSAETTALAAPRAHAPRGALESPHTLGSAPIGLPPRVAHLKEAAKPVDFHRHPHLHAGFRHDPRTTQTAAPSPSSSPASASASAASATISTPEE